MADAIHQDLTRALTRLYYMDSVTSLAVFLQGELFVLHYLNEHKGQQINPSHLSEGLHVSRSRITALLNSLRKKGLITMELSPTDRRRWCIWLTEEGEAYFQEKRKTVDAYIDKLVLGLGDQNAIDLTRLINLSVEIMEGEGK
nr:MarR family transcriptional regulator [bacterium]